MSKIQLKSFLLDDVLPSIRPSIGEIGLRSSELGIDSPCDLLMIIEFFRSALTCTGEHALAEQRFTSLENARKWLDDCFVTVANAKCHINGKFVQLAMVNISNHIFFFNHFYNSKQVLSRQKFRFYMYVNDKMRKGTNIRLAN